MGDIWDRAKSLGIKVEAKHQRLRELEALREDTERWRGSLEEAQQSTMAADALTDQIDAEIQDEEEQIRCRPKIPTKGAA